MLESATNLDICPDIIVIDNCSDENLKINNLEKIYIRSKIRLIKLKCNYGYMGAVEQCVKDLNLELYDWIFIANPDLIFIDSDVFNYLNNFSENRHDRIGIYCPAVLTKNEKKNQNPYLRLKPKKFYYYKYRLITFSYLLAYAYELLSQKVVTINLKRNKIRNIREPIRIFAAHGSFFGLSNDFFKNGGFIESRNFLYFEEEIYGYICQKLELDVIYDPRTSVLHNEHTATGKKYNFLKHQIRKDSLSIFREYIL